MSAFNPRCQFCTHEHPEEECQAKVEAELRAIEGITRGAFAAALQKSTNNPYGNAWKYDACEFCRKSSSSLDYKLVLVETQWELCSHTCMLAMMERMRTDCKPQ